MQPTQLAVDDPLRVRNVMLTPRSTSSGRNKERFFQSNILSMLLQHEFKHLMTAPTPTDQRILRT